MKTPKEEAEALVEKFYDLDETEVSCSQYCYGGSVDHKKLAVKCAIIAVEAILNALADTSVGAGPECHWQQVLNHLKQM